MIIKKIKNNENNSRIKEKEETKQDQIKDSGKSCNNSKSLISKAGTDEFNGTEDSQDITVSNILEHGTKRLLRCKLIMQKSLFIHELRKYE